MTPLRRSQMRRTSGPRRKSAPKPSPVRRDWSDAQDKREETCRGCDGLCGATLELAHLIGCEHDQPKTPGSSTLWVNPDSVVTLGGPSTDPETCHGKQHNGELDLLDKLTLEEALQATREAGSPELMRRRLLPSDYAPGIEEARRAAIEASL